MGTFCQACGAQRNPEARFCTGCGAASGAQVADHASYAPPRRPWGLWLAGVGGALALVAGIAVATGQGLPFGERSADTDGDGVVSESELMAEIRAIPLIETGKWQITADIKEADGRMRTVSEERIVTEGDPLELFVRAGTYSNRGKNIISELMGRCVVNYASLVNEEFSGRANCYERGKNSNLSFIGTRNSGSISVKFNMIVDQEGESSVDFIAEKVGKY